MYDILKKQVMDAKSLYILYINLAKLILYMKNSVSHLAS